jgi:hypothetical protein
MGRWGRVPSVKVRFLIFFTSLINGAVNLVYIVKKDSFTPLSFGGFNSDVRPMGISKKLRGQDH